MTDSVLVFPPGFRVLDANGDPVSGAKIKFYEAGTTTPKEVFSDSDLGTSLGAVVYTRSDGYPVASSGSNTTVAVYIGAGLYKVEITDADDVAIFPAKDDVQGAVDTSDFLQSGATSTLSIPVVLTTDAARSLTTSDNGKFINANTSGNSITMTLDPAATLGANWNVEIRKKHASNALTIETQGGEFIDESLTSIVLRDKGDCIQLVCDGTAFYVMNSRCKGRERQIGDIRLCSAGTARTGELECDGTSYLRADYPDLYTFIANKWGTADGTHFNVPYLSGKFLRIWDHGKSNDPNASSRTASKTGGATGDNVGSAQDDAIDDHTHGGAHTTGSSNSGGGGAITVVTGTTNTSGIATGADTSTETRPINAYVAAYILAQVF